MCRVTWRGENRIIDVRDVKKDGDTPLAGVEEETLSLRRKAKGMP